MNKCKKTITFAAATTGAVASKELFNVTGTVLATIIGVCTTNVDMTGAGATLSLGTSASVTAFIGATAGDAIDVGEMVGVHTTPPTSIVMSDTIPQWIYCKDIDLGYAVGTDSLSAGVIDFYCLWYPIVEGSTVVPQDTFNQAL